MYTFEVAKALSALPGFDVHLSLSRQAEIYRDFEVLGLPRFDVDTYSGIGSALLNSARLPIIRARFGAYLRKHEIDVVFCTMHHVWNIAIGSVIRSVGTKYLLTVHDATPHAGEDSVLKRLVLKRDVSHADGVIALTEVVKQEVFKTYSFPLNRIWVAPHGVFHYGEPTPRSFPTRRPFRLLMFGRILTYKGLDLLLDAFALLRRRRVDVELYIIGNGDMAPYAKQIHDSSGVFVTNRWIEEAEIPGILRDHDLCVLPYREASQSGVIPAAFGAALPVIITPVPGLLEQVVPGKSAIVAESVSAASLAAAIELVLADSQLYEALSKGALDDGEKAMSWAGVASKLTEPLCALANVGGKK